MFEIKMTVEAGGVLAQFLTNFLGGAPAQKSIASKPAKDPVAKSGTTDSNGGATLEQLRNVVTEKAGNKDLRPAIRTIFEAKNAKGASDLAVEYYDEVYAQLSAL